jgi:hypothetical protein
MAYVSVCQRCCAPASTAATAGADDTACMHVMQPAERRVQRKLLTTQLAITCFGCWNYMRQEHPAYTAASVCRCQGRGRSDLGQL